MKKTFNVCLLICATLLVSTFGCKKDIQVTEEATKEKESVFNLNPVANQTESFTDNISVSQYGFLVFPTEADLFDYRNFVLSSTHGEVQDYLNSISFNSLGETIYTEEYLSQPVADGEEIDYIFNAHKIFQLEDVVFKPISEINDEVKWQFILTTTTANLNNTTYESMIVGNFNATKMNKFATNPDDEDISLLDFISQNPSGHEDIQANSPKAKRPFIGSVTTCRDVEGGCFNAQTGLNDPCSYVETKRYFFWIKISQGKGPVDGPKDAPCSEVEY